EEFAFVKAFDWSTDSKNIAYIKFDETDVPQFSMDVFGKDLYPNQEVFKYPKAGEKNALASLHFYNIETQNTQNVNLSQYKDFYIARIKWSNHKDLVSIQVLNRHQNQLDLLLVNANDASVKVLYQEKNNTYIDVNDNLTFLKDNHFILSSEKDGFNHLYLFDANGKQLNAITKGNFDVTRIYGIDTQKNQIYYQSSEEGSINRSIYQIDFKGKNKIKLSTKIGTNDATFSPNYDFFINHFQNSKTPSVYEMIEVKSMKSIKEIINNVPLLDKLKKYQLPEKEFFTIKINGNDLNAYMIKPKNMENGKKYPLLMFQYSGPGSQEVANEWMKSNDYWHYLLAQEGYIIACVDGRGTGFKGTDFKKVTQKELGKYEVEDQIAAAQLFATYPYIDKNRIGIWGWSYGGFMSSNCILKGNEVFKTAIAVAPVTNWRFYDSIYTERFMTTPQENPSGYDNNSPINHVEKLKGNYLIIHGTADDNVHFQNATRMIRALQLANKQFDQAIYPDTNHGIYGGNIRLQLYTKMTNYIKEKL
ncbi:MAG: DPP IV N-terminal domain-containing protein, partial [Flavobacterium sp.]